MTNENGAKSKIDDWEIDQEFYFESIHVEISVHREISTKIQILGICSIWQEKDAKSKIMWI